MSPADHSLLAAVEVALSLVPEQRASILAEARRGASRALCEALDAVERAGGCATSRHGYGADATKAPEIRHDRPED